MIEIVAMDTPSLGDRGYLVTDGRVAFAVDPQRDIDRVLDAAREHAVEIVDVFETHVHNDYVTGGLALARATGAAYHLNAADPVAFAHDPVSDGDAIEVGPGMRVRVLATPGHTFTHLAYVLEAPGRVPAVFTGGSLLYGSAGRPDLLGAEHAHELAAAQHGSAHRLAAELPDEAEIFPTHGFGSFCSATQSPGASSTIGRERRGNPVLTLDERAYVESLLAGLDAYPAYYAHMAAVNIAGPEAPELRRRVQDGEWVVDLRSRTAFAAGHMAGTLNFGLDGSLATYLGWLIPWGTPLTLLGQTPDDVAAAQRELVRIGIDRPAASATGGPERWADGEPLASLPTASFADLAAVRHHRPVTVLDVRRAQEWDASHVDGAVHVPLHDLTGHLDRVPSGEVWVHCGTGYRASVAASLLAAAGRRVVVVDDEYGSAARTGLALVPAAA